MNFMQCLQDFSSQYGLITSLFLGGLAGSFTHCAGMCAPFVLAQGETENHKNGGKLSRLSGTLLIPYHLGRMTTYVFMAALFYSALNLVYLFSGIKALISALVLTLAGTLFLISVFPVLTQIFPWAARIQMPIPFRMISKMTGPFLNNPDPLHRYALGVLLGFMPCGLVIAAIMASSSAANLTQAVLAMGAFTIGTMPALILVTLGGQGLAMKFPKLKKTLRQGAMAVSAIWLFVLAGWMMI
jgi:uncharacterized protein